MGHGPHTGVVGATCHKFEKAFDSATKHDHSEGHKNTMQMDQLSKACTAPTGHGTILDQHRTFANEQSVSDKDVMKKMFDGALFLFRNEISHTTNWEPLIQLLSRTDFSGRIKQFVETRPRNATYQSNVAITDILESFSSVLDAQVVGELCILLKDIISFH